MSADSTFTSAVVIFPASIFRGENKNGVVAVAGAGREITDEDVERAIESASAMPLTPGWEIFNRLPQEFIVDGQDGITEPVGMSGAGSSRSSISSPARVPDGRILKSRQTGRARCRAADARTSGGRGERVDGR